MPESTDVQTLRPRFLCGCGADATTSIQFPYEPPRFFCDRDAAAQQLSKEPEPGRVYRASVVKLDENGVAIPEPAAPTLAELIIQNGALEAENAELRTQLEEATRPALVD